ncbi:MAG: MotA/TolQ/ExbB proton channel family protein [Bdellovibrionales bacterium]|nr:MotA/TolQ/ExbB proton channel family protein [Bdellovibrionales bacterium]
MQFITGIIISFVAITFSIFHLKQDFSNYVDPVGVIVVLGGTLAVATIIFPWQDLEEIKLAVRVLFRGTSIDLKVLNRHCFNLIQSALEGQPKFDLEKAETLAHRTLQDGAELIQLGFPTEKIRSILEERIFQSCERKIKIANVVRSLSKYPPAFGLVGTVLGLMSLMRSISEGASSTETGLRMAVALVATLYGLLVANLVINPAGENLLKRALEEKKASELAHQAVILASLRTNLLESQETLNSFVPKRDRLNLFSDGIEGTGPTLEEAS